MCVLNVNIQQQQQHVFLCLVWVFRSSHGMDRYHKQFEKRRVREYASIVEWPFHSSCRWVWSLSLLWWLLWFSCPNLYLFLSFSRCECAKEISSSVHAFLSHSLFPFSLVLSLWQKKCVFDFHFSITLDKTERVNSRNFESHPLFECFFVRCFDRAPKTSLIIAIS